jgi:thiosulfate/3-mercaptopyruvate sulfurtransferase
MYRSTLAAAAALFLALPAVAQSSFGPLLSASELRDLAPATAPLIMDIRGDAYAEGHIPNAISAPYALFRGPSANPGQLPELDALEATLRSLGVTTDRPVVIVHQGANETDFGAAARVYWTLKSSGVSQLAILNGGVLGWTAEGLALSTQATAPVASNFDLAFSDQWLATTDQVAALAANGGALLLDARPESFWSGNQAHPAAARPGTLPQSQYFEHANWFSGGPAIVDAQAARSLATAQGFTDADQLVSFCNTGHWAATNWFALSELAGIENVKLYPESMVGYSQAGHEMANVPGVFRNLMNQIRDVF